MKVPGKFQMLAYSFLLFLTILYKDILFMFYKERFPEDQKVKLSH